MTAGLNTLASSARLENTRTASESKNGATPIADSFRNEAFQLKEAIKT